MAMLIWVTCAVIGTMVMSRPELVLSAISGSVFLLKLGSVLMISMARVTTGVIGTMNFEI